MAIEWTTKRRNELVPGELFITQDQKNNVGIAMANEDNEILALILGNVGSTQVTPKVYPLDELKEPVRVIANGDWDIGPLDQSTEHNDNRSAEDSAGDLYVEPSGDRVLLLEDGIRGPCDFANLDDGRFSNPDAGSIPHKTWEMFVRDMNDTVKIISRI